jgi:hypothetical protein
MAAKIIPLLPRVLSEQLRWVEQIQDDDRARRLAQPIAHGILKLLRRGAVHEDAALVAMLAITLRFLDAPWASEVAAKMKEVSSMALRREARRRLGDHPPGEQERLLRHLARDP